MLLPVLILAGFGALSLRKDRVLLETEVRERADQLAKDIAQRVWNRLTSLPSENSPSPSESGAPEAGSGVLTFRVSAQGDLLDPPGYSAFPSPSARDSTRLADDQEQLWRRIDNPRPADQMLAARVSDLRAFLETKPDPAFASLAHFRLAGLLREFEPMQAVDEYRAVIRDFPDSTGETGLPLAPMAQAQLITLELSSPSNHEASIRSELLGFASNALAKPSLLSPWVLQQVSRWEQPYLGTNAVGFPWTQRWNLAQRQRAIFASAANAVTAARGRSRAQDAGRSSEAWPELFWFHHQELTSGLEALEREAASGRWLAAKDQLSSDGSQHFICWDSRRVDSILSESAPSKTGLSDYLALSYEIAGVANPQPAAISAQRPAQPRRLLATASCGASNGSAALTATVWLADPSSLYARQRQRSFWFSALIVSAAAVALLGLASTWAAFRQQQQLYDQQTNFVSSVTHELRAPIGAVRLMAENLKHGKVPEPSEQRRFLNFIVQECCRLSSMIENVLKLARIEQGRNEYDFEPTDVVRLAEDTLKLMEPAAADGQVAIELEIDRRSFAGLANEPVLDGRAIQQVLVNLIDNALKHSPPNSTVTVGCSLGSNKIPGPANAGATDSEGKSSIYLRLSVVDRGPGIPVEEHEKIFQRFYRRGTELRRETPGVGIGLSIVKHIVEAHHGQIRVESELGRGSRFVCELPLPQSIERTG